jgi:hypothetical protein
MSRPVHFRNSPPCTLMKASEPPKSVKKRPNGPRASLRCCHLHRQSAELHSRSGRQPHAPGCWRLWQRARGSTLGSFMSASTCTALRAGASSSRRAQVKVCVPRPACTQAMRPDSVPSRLVIHLLPGLTLQWMPWKPALASAVAHPCQGHPPSLQSVTLRCWLLRLASPCTKLRPTARLEPLLRRSKRTLQPHRSMRHLAPKTMTPDEMQCLMWKKGKLRRTRYCETWARSESKQGPILSASIAPHG